MLPPLLTHDITQGLRHFLTSAYEPSNPFFRGLMERFVADERRWLKGPYIQLGLPFRVGAAGTQFFPGFSTDNPGYLHQENAWQRLSTQHLATNTLVATGTGSGKTECFLYPLLDHAARMQEAGGTEAQGIKALVIYPMNALASDQARRFAEEVAKQPAFAKLRVGLFVGGGKTHHGGNPAMTATEVITDRDVLRRNPPDILLTNYKMLDYLLIRPKDRQLWSQNLPTTLRYIVIDELHSFDGAQGTDLALLLRRLRARLLSPAQHLIFAGTSATLGNGTDTSGLREYARQITGADFPPASVIVENRLTVAEFLGDATIEHVFQMQDDLEIRLNPSRFASQEAAVAEWFTVLFPNLPAPIDVQDPRFRCELGNYLKTHLLTHNLLKLSKGFTSSLHDLVDGIQGPLPVAARPQATHILNALLTLLAWARSPSTHKLPLLTFREQVWVRELRRMVAKVNPEPENVNLVASADLPIRPDGVHLPLIQCADCRTTGWLSIQQPGTGKISLDLDEIYNNWFGNKPEVARFYPYSVALKRPAVDGTVRVLCGECGNLQAQDGTCSACGFENLIRVFQTTGITQKTYNDRAVAFHDSTCPACACIDRQLLIGARNTTLGAQVIERSWASAFNDDKKLIAFSDSVQDAAHRAGYFAARTYRNIIRYALAQSLEQLPRHITFGDLLKQMPSAWENSLGREAFVTTFIGPNMLWLHDWEQLQSTDQLLPHNSRLPARVNNRLAWEVFSELTYLSKRGRTLDQLGLATLSPDLSTVSAVATDLISTLENQLGIHGVTQATVLQWLWGLLYRLRLRGGVTGFEFLLTYGEDAKDYVLTKLQGREEWMPSLGKQLPTWVTLGSHRHFDRITQGDQNWYHQWLMVTLGRDATLMANGLTKACYEMALQALHNAGVLVRAESDAFGISYALDANTLQVTTDVCRLAIDSGVHAITVANDWADALMGMHSPSALTEALTQTLPPNIQDAAFMARANVHRVISAEHTGLLGREAREALERRFKAKPPASQPWHENLLSATPTLEMGVDIGSLSSVLLCSVPPNQASFLQRIGRAGRRDGNAVTTTLADGGSPHDLYFFEEIDEMLSGEVSPPAIFLKAAEVLRRQLLAFCLDGWVSTGIPDKALPDKTSEALDAVQSHNLQAFPHSLLDFMQRNENELLAQFTSLLGQDADERVIERLQEFIMGSESQQTLRWQLLNLLEGLVKERSVHKQRADKLKSEIAKEKAKPEDDARNEAIDRFDLQRAIALQQIRDINERDLLNTLTDGGLIPNYAFPEVGIQLKSMLWRKKASDEVANGKYVTLPEMNFERPASSALSEFAPENKFYANQRRVEINQIDMKLATLEEWRLCPSCHHMENLTLVADSQAACPRCGDLMWANISQKQTLLRFKQAIANTEDGDARIDDRQEEREPKFYMRQLMVGFTPEEVTCAWRLDSQTLPFGFEFISQAQFRDINFGERGKNGQSTKFAGSEAARPGFSLCRECGMVQIPKRRQLKPGETLQSHSFDCSKRLIDDAAHLIDCLYLYREFSSEALRILVPFTRAGIDDKAIQSFMAAIQLGLKKRFGGKVDHLRLTSYSVPGKETEGPSHFVMLYDAVPGGTGYLHQLLSEKAQTLGEVLQLALDQLISCSCNDDPEKDGCYRCVYQYRLGRAMRKTSRNTARDILSELLAQFDQLEPATNLDGLSGGAHLDSVLEARFLPALVRLGKEKDMPTVKVHTDIVKGKSGYQLQVGPELYWVEPQVELGTSEGYVIGCKPDFVLWPRLTQSPRRPIAVFTDGWHYHKDTPVSDAFKRTGLIRSQQFWVWSVTWDDVQAALEGNPQTDLESPFGAHVRQHKTPSGMAPEKELYTLNSLGLLLTWLASPAHQEDNFLKRLQTTQFCLAMQCLGANAQALEPIARPWLQRLPNSVALADDARFACAASHEAQSPQLLLDIPKRWAMDKQAIEAAPVLWLLNDHQTDEKTLHRDWRKWLSWSNQLQVLPGFWLLTQKTLDHDLLPAFAELGQGRAEPPKSADDMVWQGVLNQSLSDFKPGLAELQTAGIQPPDEQGYELPDEHGHTAAEAELAWHVPAVVVLHSSQTEYTLYWREHGWQVIEATTPDWPTRVIAALSRQGN